MKPVLVFIPGLVSDARVWRAVADRMQSEGYVTKIADVSRASSLTAMAQQIVDDQPGSFIPIGHSMGGRVALEIYRLVPEQVLGLGLVATGAHPLAEGELEKREAVIELANQQGMKALSDLWLPPMLHPDIPEKQPALYSDLQSMVIEAGAEVHERQIRALIHRPDARPILKEIRCPALLVAGEQDGWSSPEQHRQMMAIMEQSDSHLEVVADAGHFLQTEKPDSFSDLLLRWLATVERG